MNPMQTTTHTLVDSPVEPIALVTDGTALTGLFMQGHRHVRQEWGPQLPLPEAPAVLREAAQQLAEYFTGERTVFDLPLAPVGTAFQQRVWDALRAIPYAHTRSYGQVALQIGAPTASRAVGMANGRNPLSIIVPCHRVVGANGSLIGYGGGVERKRILLDLERRVAGVAPAAG